MRATGALLAVAIALPPRAASAQSSTVPAAPQAWEPGSDRWFAAGLVDAGPLYFRPRISAGWGRPFFRWVGLDANPVLSGEGLGAYAGARATLPGLDLRIGARYFFAFFRSFLEPRPEFDRLAIEIRDGPSSRYLTLEAELTGRLPVGPGSLLAVLTGASVQLVPRDYYVFEETLKLVADPPWIWQVRGGYEIPLGADDVASAALVGEVAGNPGRESLVVRIGVTASMRLWPNLELRGALVPAWHSNDSIGAAGGQWFEIGIRFRFATGVPANLTLPAMW